MTRVVIIGGGPGGYEAALVGAQLGASVTVVDRDGLGGAAVLTDVVPSKTLIAAAEILTRAVEGARLGLQFDAEDTSYARVGVDVPKLNARIRDLAAKQSEDIAERLRAEGISVIRGAGYFRSAHTVGVHGTDEVINADVVLIGRDDARLHEGGLRLPRLPGLVRGGGVRRPGHLPRLAGEAGGVP